MVQNIKKGLQWKVNLFLPLTPATLLPSPHVKVKAIQSCSTLCDPMDYTFRGTP